MRHGRAEPGRDKPDRKRELTDRGKRDIERVGVRLHDEGWLPDAVVASPATRAHITAETALEAGGRDTAGLTIDARIYEASSTELLEVLADFAEGPARVMMVGHNPGLSKLLGFLSSQQTALDPGMLARLSMPADWAYLHSGCADLLDLVDPRTLPTDAPLPG